MKPQAWPVPEHVYTGLRGQEPRAFRLPGGTPRPDAYNPISTCPKCGYTGLFAFEASSPPRSGQGYSVWTCPRCVPAREVDALWRVLLREPRRNNHWQITNVARVGRNDPCPCGSGRKSKKCCHA